jgi:hypothetical protein
LDHVDCDRTNNKIDNLRESTISQNNHNRPISKNNKSGVKGLREWTSRHGTEYWHCRVRKDGIPEQCFFRKDLPNSRQFAEQWLIKTRSKLHGDFANNG